MLKFRSVLRSVVTDRPMSRFSLWVMRRSMRSSVRVPFLRSPVTPSNGRHSLVVSRLVARVLLKYSTDCERLYVVFSRGSTNTRPKPRICATFPYSMSRSGNWVLRLRFVTPFETSRRPVRPPRVDSTEPHPRLRDVRAPARQSWLSSERLPNCGRTRPLVSAPRPGLVDTPTRYRKPGVPLRREKLLPRLNCMSVETALSRPAHGRKPRRARLVSDLAGNTRSKGKSQFIVIDCPFEIERTDRSEESSGPLFCEYLEFHPMLGRTHGPNCCTPTRPSMLWSQRTTLPRLMKPICSRRGSGSVRLR